MKGPKSDPPQQIVNREKKKPEFIEPRHQTLTDQKIAYLAAAPRLILFMPALSTASGASQIYDFGRQ